MKHTPKIILTTVLISVPIVATGIISYFYIANKMGDGGSHDETVISKVITENSLDFTDPSFNAPTKVEIKNTIVQKHSELTIGDFDITTEIPPFIPTGFTINIIAAGEIYSGSKRLTINYKLTNEINLNDVITKDKINKKFDKVPSDNDIPKILKAEFPKLRIDLIDWKWEEKKIINENILVISPKEDTPTAQHYTEKANITLTWKIDISSNYLEKEYDFEETIDHKPTIEEIISIITTQNEDGLQPKDIKVDIIPSKNRKWNDGKALKVRVKAQGNDFIGSTDTSIKWNYTTFTELSKIFEGNTTLKEAFNSSPDEDALRSAIDTMLDDHLIWDDIKMDNQVDNKLVYLSARSGNNREYKGQTFIYYKIKLDIQSVFNHENDKIIFTGGKPTEDEIKQRIMELNSPLLDGKFTVNITEDATPGELAFDVVANENNENYIGTAKLTGTYSVQ